MRPTPLAAVISIGLLAAAACGTGAGKPRPTVRTTIEFATQDQGREGNSTRKAVAEFEKANPGLTVNILPLSANPATAYQELSQHFGAGSSTPDVIAADVIWPATFAQSSWIMPLDRFHANTSNFFSNQTKTGIVKDKLYAIPWFIDAEGVSYRKDFTPTQPKSPEELVAAAKGALGRNPSINVGLAYEGARSEGTVAAFLTFASGFGGSLDLNRIYSPENIQALTYMRDAIYVQKVSPQSVTVWQESDVEQAYLAGHAAFAISWSSLLSLAEEAKSPLKGKTDLMPFPSHARARSAVLGGESVVINSRSKQADAAFKFISFLTTDRVQIDRAVSAGDPPAVRSAYNASLYSKAPYYKLEKPLFEAAIPRPVTPLYPRASAVLQMEIYSALSNQKSPTSALLSAQAQINSILAGGG